VLVVGPARGPGVAGRPVTCPSEAAHRHNICSPLFNERSFQSPFQSHTPSLSVLFLTHRSLSLSLSLSLSCFLSRAAVWQKPLRAGFQDIRRFASCKGFRFCSRSVFYANTNHDLTATLSPNRARRRPCWRESKPHSVRGSPLSREGSRDASLKRTTSPQHGSSSFVVEFPAHALYFLVLPSGLRRSAVIGCRSTGSPCASPNDRLCFWWCPCVKKTNDA